MSGVRYGAMLLVASLAFHFGGAPPTVSSDRPVDSWTESELRRIFQQSPLPNPPPDSSNRFADDDAAAVLGQYLFFDERLSPSGKVSCATCHDPQKSFADGKTLSEGMARGRRHTQTIWNVAYGRWFFWDGRADTLWSQSLQPIERANEIGSNRLALAHWIYDSPALRQAYEAIFGSLPDLTDETRFPANGMPLPGEPENPLAAAWSRMSAADQDAINRVLSNIGKAIAAYQRKIVSRNAAFDTYVEGLRTGDTTKLGALSESAKRGLAMFIGDANCRLCHSGPNFSDGEFHNILAPPGEGDPDDRGRLVAAEALKKDIFNATGPYSDDPNGSAADRLRFLLIHPRNAGEFKTPTLRNIARTAPYMRHGQFKTLREVLHYYSTLEGAVKAGHHHQESILVPLNLSAQEADDLVAFLESLTDERIDPDLLKPPPAPTRDAAQR